MSRELICQRTVGNAFQRFLNHGVLVYILFRIHTCLGQHFNLGLELS